MSHGGLVPCPDSMSIPSGVCTKTGRIDEVVRSARTGPGRRDVEGGVVDVVLAAYPKRSTCFALQFP